MYALVHYPAIEQELPVIQTYCHFTPAQILTSAFVTLASGAKIEVTEEQLAAEYGIARNDATLQIYLDDEDLYDTTIDLVFKNTVEEEPTWFNTTYLRLNYIKPPCYVTAEHIASVAGGLNYNLEAKKQVSTDSAFTSTNNDQIVRAFNHTTEFWCGSIDVLLQTESNYLTFNKNTN